MCCNLSEAIPNALVNSVAAVPDNLLLLAMHKTAVASWYALRLAGYILVCNSEVFAVARHSCSSLCVTSRCGRYIVREFLAPCFVIGGHVHLL